MAAGRGDRGRALALLASLVFLAGAAACSSPPAADGRSAPSRRSGCLPGMTALAPRTLGQGVFSGLALAGGDVVATAVDVQSFPLDGAPASRLAQVSGPEGLVVVGDTAYFMASVPAGAPDAEGKDSSAQSLFSVPLAGGPPTLVSDAPLTIDGAVTDGAAIYFSGVGAVTRLSVPDGARVDLPLPAGLMVDAMAPYGGALYVAAQDLRSPSATNGTIVKLPTAGGAAEALVVNIGHPWSLVADASGLSWVEEPPVGQLGGSTIRRAGLDGRGATTLLAHGATSLAVSDGALFVADGGLSKVPLAGGAEQTLVGGLVGPGRLTVSGGNAVWIDPATQALSATTPPALMTTCW